MIIMVIPIIIKIMINLNLFNLTSHCLLQLLTAWRLQPKVKLIVVIPIIKIMINLYLIKKINLNFEMVFNLIK